jgi:hypothetical protein
LFNLRVSILVKFAVAADYVFDGATLRRDCAVEGLDTHLPSGAWLAPGFIHMQINGGCDVLLNGDPRPSGIAAVASALRALWGQPPCFPPCSSETSEKMLAPGYGTDMVALNPAAIRALATGVAGTEASSSAIRRARRPPHRR